MSDEYCKHGSRIYCVQCSNDAPLAALRDELARVKAENTTLNDYHKTIEREAEKIRGLRAALAAAVAERDELKERNDRQAETLKLVGPYPHMCWMDHNQIGYQGEYREGDERCPVCFERDRADALESERDELRRALGAICKHHSDLYDMPGYTVKHSDLGKLIDRAAALVARHDTVRGEEGKDEK